MRNADGARMGAFDAGAPGIARDHPALPGDESGARRAGAGRRPFVTPVEPLTDGVVLLRLPHADDGAAVYTHGQGADVAETGWLPLPVPCAHADAAHLIQEFQQGWQGRFGLTLGITTPPATALRGVVHLSLHAPDVGEVAYGVAPPYRRCGLATRAVRLVSAWAVAQRRLVRLEICVTARGVHGVASQRVAEQAGFSLAGLRRSYVAATGATYEDRLYALTAASAPGALDPPGG